MHVPRARKPYGGRRRDRLTQRARNPLVRLAERHLSTNVDRVPRNHIPDIMGMAIDSARLAVVRHDFVEALTVLSEAASGSFATRSSLELLLELMIV